MASLIKVVIIPFAVQAMPVYRLAVQQRLVYLPIMRFQIRMARVLLVAVRCALGKVVGKGFHFTGKDTVFRLPGSRSPPPMESSRATTALPDRFPVGVSVCTRPAVRRRIDRDVREPCIPCLRSAPHPFPWRAWLPSEAGFDRPLGSLSGENRVAGRRVYPPISPFNKSMGRAASARWQARYFQRGGSSLCVPPHPAKVFPLRLPTELFPAVLPLPVHSSKGMPSISRQVFPPFFIAAALISSA